MLFAKSMCMRCLGTSMRRGAPIVACSKLLFVLSGLSACVLGTACVKHLASCAALSLPTSVQQGQVGVHAVHAGVGVPVTFTPCVSEGLTAFLLDLWYPFVFTRSLCRYLRALAVTAQVSHLNDRSAPENSEGSHDLSLPERFRDAYSWMDVRHGRGRVAPVLPQRSRGDTPHELTFA